MNGRCTADPLDHADDICEFCGDEFCRSCLIQTRGGKGQQICRDCAIRNSGIKGSKSNKPRPSKAQVARARQALAESKETRNAKTFEFFDEAADYSTRHDIEAAPAPQDEPDEEAKAQGAKRRFSLRRKSDETSTDEVEPTALDEFDEQTEELAPPPPSAPSGRSTPATTLIESGALARTPSGTSPSDISEPDDPIAAADIPWDDAHRGPVPPGAGAGAGVVESPGSLADRLRTRSVPAAPIIPSFALPASNSGHDPAPSTIDQLPLGSQLDADPFAIALPDEGPSSPAPLDVSFPTPPPTQAPTQAFDWQSTLVPSGENLDDDPFSIGDPFAEPVDVATEPMTPPAASQEPFAARQRAADQVVAAAPDFAERRSESSPAPIPDARSQWTAPTAPHAPSTPPPVVAPEPAAAAMTSRPAVMAAPTGSGAPVAGAADTDANGNWIPPLLRGMAPVAERQAAPLPKRRNND